MSSMTSQQIFDTVDRGLQKASRWPRLLVALGLEMRRSRPGPVQLNDSLQRLGFSRALDEAADVALTFDDPIPDSWWRRIARDVTGNEDASVDAVIDGIRSASRAAAG